MEYIFIFLVVDENILTINYHMLCTLHLVFYSHSTQTFTQAQTYICDRIWENVHGSHPHPILDIGDLLYSVKL